MEIYEALMTTRSMRRLTDDPPVTDEEIEHCLRAAAQAPSGGNVQPYHFVVITDAEARAAMADLYLRGWRRYRPAMVAALPPFPTAEAEGSFRSGVELSEHLAEHLADTPSVLFCLATFDSTLADDEGPLDVGTLHASVFPAVQSFILAARDLGLGATLTTVFRVHTRRSASVRPASHLDPVALVPIGRPLGRFGVAPRKPIRKITHWNRYGQRRRLSPALDGAGRLNPVRSGGRAPRRSGWR
jgi:nitroreductase